MNTDSLSLSNLLRPDVRANPYPFYHEMRATDPVHWDDALGFWAVTRYADVMAVLHDTRFAKARGLEAALNRYAEPERELARPVYDVFARQMLYADPPDHARLRGLVSKAFTPRVIEQMRAHIEQVVNHLLDAVQTRGQMDVIRDLAFPLPATVIMEMLGLPLAEREQFKHWSNDFAAMLGTVRHGAAEVARARQSVSEITDYITTLHEQLHHNPRGDLLSALVAVEEQGSVLSHAELTANALLLLAAGHETTTNLIVNGLLALLRHPDQLRQLRDDPNLMGPAIEELLRYDNPVQIVWRYATDDVDVGDKTIRNGQLVNVIVGAANRDPAQFDEPDRLDACGRESRHMGFGLGIHFCLGAPLARMEGEIAFNTLLRRMPRLQLASNDLQWQENPTFRGLKSLPVVF